MLFLPIVALLYWRTTGGARLLLVAVASYIFYMSWLPAYAVLLLALTAANWLLALGIGKSLSARSANEQTEGASGGNEGQSSSCSSSEHAAKSRRELQGSARPLVARLLFAAGLLLNLGCLCYYKYTNFFLSILADGVNGLLAAVAKLPALNWQQAPLWNQPVLDVILPLGISFFVFEFVHYLADVYKGDKPVRSFLEFATFASFFPSQIAGPIKRYQDFCEKLRKPEPFAGPLFVEGTTLIMKGLFKKVAIADPIGAVIFTPFTSLSALSSADALIAMIGFVIQVYCDFSGYTDIGRGSALLLGIRLPENFQLPYLSHDLSDFWRRWHMSLSYWLRDYVYIPLGGSKGGILFTWRNLFITMVACGLWHGASWHYVVFGALQGVGLIANREWRNLLAHSQALAMVFETSAGRWFGTFLTMSFITVTYAIFRAPDMAHASNMLMSAFNFGGPCALYETIEKSGIICFLGVYVIYWLISDFLSAQPKLLPATRALGILQPSMSFAMPVRLASWTAALILMAAAKPLTAVPFVYFQF